MNTTEGERMTRIARIMREQDVTYDTARYVADAEIRIEQRRADREGGKS